MNTKIVQEHSALNQLGDYHSDSHPDPELLTNSELLALCRQLGSISVKSRRMFVGLLPLLQRRQAYDLKKFSTIHHFASIVGGVGFHLTEEVLRLDAQLADLPLLRRELYKGDIGWSKIRVVLSLATRDNQEHCLNWLRVLSRSALIVYVRELRSQTKDEQRSLLTDIIETSCLTDQNSTESSSLQQHAISEAENFAGEIIESYNQEKISQYPIRENENNIPDDSQVNSPNTRSISQKQLDLRQKRETISFQVNSWLAAQLRLYRQKLEKQSKRLITWEDTLAKLLRRAQAKGD